MSNRGIVLLLSILLSVFLVMALIASRRAELDEKLEILAVLSVIWVLSYNCYRRMHYIKGD